MRKPPIPESDDYILKYERQPGLQKDVTVIFFSISDFLKSK